MAKLLLLLFFFVAFLEQLSLISSATEVEKKKLQTFIVSVRNDLKPSAFMDVEQWYKSTLTSLGSYREYSSHTEETQEFLHVYRKVFHGFSAELTPEQAEELKISPGILGVLPDRLRQLHTTRSPHFLGLTTPSGSNPTELLKESDSGSNVVIGIMDTGIWPESRSFHDDGIGPIPTTWKGECTEGEKFTKANCNKKIVGARYFLAGYEARVGKINETHQLRSARDTEGHGTHTASTAAGSAVHNASLFGYANGVAVGVAPKARIAVYKICWKDGCMDSDILAAFDKAVEDGVNILSLSLGGYTGPYNLDPIAIGSFAAMEKGIFVSTSAGNDGPDPMRVTNLAPWITTVGAGTIDRKFPADLVLEHGRKIEGSSVYSLMPLPANTYFPIIYGGNASTGSSNGGSYLASMCMPGSLDKELVRGKIVVCDRGGGLSRTRKGEVVKEAGGVGVVIANVPAGDGEGLIADSHIIPGLSISESARQIVLGYIKSSKNPRATMIFRGTQIPVKPAPLVASFSSRGPSQDSWYVLKPDVIAPGANILAAWPDSLSPSELDPIYDPRHTEFNLASGTSMSCPHLSGVAALLKGAHPDWSPAMIRSAIMTTAYTIDLEGKPLLDEYYSYKKLATIYDTGAGHVNPEKAVDPGLVYDLAAEDYINFLCASKFSRADVRMIARRPVSCCSKKKTKPWNLNYPAISVVFEASESQQSIVVTRTVTHVNEKAGRYVVSVTNPKGATVTINPSVMEFKVKSEKQSFTVTIKTMGKLEVQPGKLVAEMGKITWSNGSNEVVSPVIVVWQKGY